MNVKPVANRILVQLHFPPEDNESVVLPDINLNIVAEGQRTRVECLAIGPAVTTCKPGDFLILVDEAIRNFVPTNKEPAQGLFHESVVIAIESPNG